LLSSIGDIQGNFCQPVLHALTLTCSCHSDSALVDAAPRMTAQHLLQPLVVRNTAPTFLHLLTMWGAQAQRLGRPQRQEGWLPSQLCCHTRARYCSWS